MAETRRQRSMRSLYALASQQGHPRLLDVESVVDMLEMRDDLIRDLQEFQREVISDYRRDMKAKRKP